MPSIPVSNQYELVFVLDTALKLLGYKFSIPITLREHLVTCGFHKDRWRSLDPIPLHQICKSMIFCGSMDGGGGTGAEKDKIAGCFCTYHQILFFAYPWRYVLPYLQGYSYQMLPKPIVSYGSIIIIFYLTT